MAPRRIEQGPHTVLWDGSGDQGQDLPSGVYLYTITTDQGVQSGKMSLIR